MDLSTEYLGFRLPHPLIPGASPIVDDLDVAKRYEDAGAPALVMHSLFEEQIEQEERATYLAMEQPAHAYGEALSYFPASDEFRLGPHAYLEQIRKLKRALGIPVIASLNGTSLGGWLDYARQIEQAGADGLELNVYALNADTAESGQQIEQRTLQIVKEIKSQIQIPVAVKLSPFYTALAHFASGLERAGADALVLFNRFYQPNLDIEELEVTHALHLSTSSELLLRLRWIAILDGQRSLSFAVSGGVHSVEDVVKSVMVGANAVQMVSALLAHGPDKLEQMCTELKQWLETHEYDSLSQMRGSMNLARSPDPKAYERANYLHVLHSWREL